MSNGSARGYSDLISRLDRFIRKFYLNQFLRGLIFFFAVSLVGFLLINIIEYFLNLNTTGRKVLFFSYLALSAGLLVYWVGIPLAKMFSLGSRITRENAALIIGKHFPEVEDKLLNLLQLSDGKGVLDQPDLMLAAIDQRTVELKPVPFMNAIDLKLNRKHLKYLAVPISALVIILFASPSLIPEASFRLLRNDIEFVPDAPFLFKYEPPSTSVYEGDDVEIDLQVDKLTSLPSEVFVIANGYKYKMKSEGNGSFNYTINQIKEPVRIEFEAEGYSSKDFFLDVVMRPKITSFEIDLDYPSYINLEDRTMKNIGDLQIPEGTLLRWKIVSSNVTGVFIETSNDTLLELSQLSLDLFQGSYLASESFAYEIISRGTVDGLFDTVRFSVDVTGDFYPEISVDQYQDSIEDRYLYFLGEAKDDYGLKNLQFVYSVESPSRDSVSGRAIIQYLPISSNSLYEQFNHFFDITSLGLVPGDKVSYYFQACDNDGFNGSKCSKSQLMVYQMPSMDEITAEVNEGSSEIKDDLAGAIEESQELQEEVNALKERLLEDKNLSWEDKQAIEKVLSDQQKLEESINSIQQEMESNFNQQREFQEPNQDLINKQEMLQELFDSVFDEEMKELMKKLEEMLEEAADENMLDELSEMEMNNEEVEKELDRMLELFKNLEFQQRMEETKDALDELAKEQEELAEETKEGNNTEEQKEKQGKLNEEFEKLADEMEELEKLNEELSKPQDGFEEMKDGSEEVKEQQENASEQLDQGKKKNASESQQNAADEMKEMSDKMSSMMSSMQMEQQMEDMESLRQLLENLVTLSFEQENLIYEIQATDVGSPKYVSLVQDQFKLRDDSKLVEDSLYALAGRVFEIQSFITEQITDINREMDKAIDALEDRKNGKANVSQQFVMTGYNNLALMLSEVLDQMQQAAASSMSGSQNCQNPSQSKGKGEQLGDIGQMQQQLNDQINQLSEMMKNGGKPQGQGGMSKQLSQMAAKQSAIREALRQLNESQNSDGTNGLGELEELMKQMDQTETDLVNKQLTEELLNRQQEITVKLLEAAEAEKQREKDKQRESQVGMEMDRPVPPSLEEYLKARDAEIELYRTVPADLKPYYKGLVEKYFKNISFNAR